MSRVWKLIIDNSLLLLVGAVTALLWANLHHASYEQFSHSLRFIVNDIGMVFFFALATKEIFEATLPGGPLSSPREAGVPLLAAVGGMAAPAALYLVQATLEGRPELLRGWAIPCATDIAFSYLAARFVFPPNHPAIPFLLLLAIADDALGLILLAMFYPSAPLSVFKLATFMIPALAVALWLKRRATLSFWPYVVGAGGLSWLALHFGGIHPALALVPIVPFMPHEKRDLGLFDPRETDLPYTMNRFEHAVKLPVQFVLLLFGLVNAGVTVSSVGSATWIVLVSLVLGKPIGITLATFLSIKAGLRAPGGLNHLHTAVLGIAAGIGFTVALFFATAAFPPGPVLDEAKMGALLSFIAAPLAVIVGRLAGLHPKKAYARPAPSRGEGTPARR